MAKKRAKKQDGPKADFVVNRKAVCIVVDVDDPYFNAAHSGAKGNTRTVRAAYNMMESPIAYMIAKGQVTQAEGEAGLKFRRIFEMAGGTGAAAMDYTKEPVDGGGAMDPLTERRWRAGRELQEIRDLLGPSGYELVRDVCGAGYFISQIFPTKWQQTKAGKNLKQCLTYMSRHWGFETTRIRRWGKAIKTG